MSLILLLQKMKKGEKINELELPYPITPEYICGCSRKERVNNFMVIMKDYSNRKKEALHKFEVIKERFKQLSKREFTKNVLILVITYLTRKIIFKKYLEIKTRI